MSSLPGVGACLVFVVFAGFLPADEPAKESGEEAKKVLEGHSYHGEAFNEGPRQKAYLMAGTGPMNGTGRVQFPVTPNDPIVQKHKAQGVGQLHGFWYFEAERSFRQAAALEPSCAMAYWGMAQANVENEKRAKGFIEESIERKDGITEREVLYIDSFKRFLDAGRKKRKERASRYVKDLEKIIYENPDDVEAKAFLVVQMWKNNRAGVPINSSGRSSRPSRCTPRITTVSTSGTTSVPRSRCVPRFAAVSRRRASRTCGTCPVTSSRVSSVTTTRPGSRKLQRASITLT